MAVHASALLLQHTAWKASTFAQDSKLQQVAAVQIDEREIQHDVHLARLWIGGKDGAAGFADLTRLVAQLKAAASSDAKIAAQDVDLGHSLVYSWSQAQPQAKSHL
jgi:hypothetical protein